jgi:hypothetical protein
MVLFRDNWMKVVTSLAFDEHLGLIATGSNNGKIAVSVNIMFCIDLGS